MHHAVKTVIVIAACVGIGLLAWTTSIRAASGAPAPAVASPAASPSAETTATPASAATVRHALKQRARAKRALRVYRHTAAYFLGHPHVSVGQRPRRAASEGVWLRAGKRWHRLADGLQRRTGRLLEKMCSTSGGGALRWRPLIRYWWPEWSESQVYLMAHIIWHESSGRPFVHMYTHEAYGLFQHLPNPGPLGVMAQARLAHSKYTAMGGLSPWAGCRAFSCGGGCGIY